ncbi:cytochrome P450 71D9-like [Populus alba x Populus x berolinensis]|uniref:Cytochrome P450 71D9-like n=1 Tax=Populus alba x Populus x berolinensis TaxID=444605 RepID=A0AAD6QHX3_9ROSI|nr:cytochrome P450 71D9-like [Populus alba x Populus x berolinensis]
MEFPILLASLLFIFAVLRLWKKSKGNGSTPALPPGPWKLPLIGNIHQLAGSLPHHGLTDLAKKYGPVMQLQIGEVPTVVVSSGEAAKEVMKTHEINFVERPCLLVANIMFYNRKNIGFAPYGDYWRQMRKVCTLELFSAKRVRSFRSVREEEVSNFIRNIYAKAGSPINLSKMMLDLSNGVIARTSIGKKSKNQEAFLPIIEDVAEALAGLNIVDVFPSAKFLYMISTLRSRLERSHKEADEILENIINERRASKEETKTDQDNEVEVLLDVLLNLQNQGSLEFPLTTDSIKAIIMEMFGAGSETTSTLLEWSMSEMLKNPRVMKKAQEEVRQVFSDSENVDETGLKNLKFLKLVIKETLRLHPPISLIPRECSKTCEINGFVIQAKSKVIINAWAIGRDSNDWTEAEKFYPERFQDSSVDYKGTNFEFIPFGAGKRMCPGMLFGIGNAELLLARLLYHFDWKLSNGAALEDLDMNEAFGGTVTKKHYLDLIPIPYGPCPLPVE